MSWSTPAWVGFSDGRYSELIQRKTAAVTRRDKRCGGQYTVKKAIEAIDEAFHRCNGSDHYDGSKLDPELLGTSSNERSKEGERAPNPIVMLEGRLDVTKSIKQFGEEQLSSLTPGCMLSRRSRDQLLSYQRAEISQFAAHEVIGSLDVDQLGAIARASRHFDWLLQSFLRLEPATP